MSTTSQDQVEAEARRLLRELITRLPWYPGMSAAERAKRIEEDVDRWWLLKIEDAAERLGKGAPSEPTSSLTDRGSWSAPAERKRRAR